MDVQVNYVAVVLAAAVSMFVGFVWYARPVFGNTWSKLVGLDEAKQKAGMGKAMTQAIIAALLTAYILAHVTYLSNHFFGNSFMAAALSTAFWLWLGISATTIVTHNAFEQRPTKLTVLAVGSQLANFLAMALVIGWLKP